jgi:hypothetical protein
MPAHIVRDNATRARVRAQVEHVFAAEKCRLGLVVRTVGMVRARVKIAWPTSLITSLGWLGCRRKQRPRQAPATGRITKHRLLAMVTVE